MITLSPVTLEGHGIRLEPLTLHHAPALASAATDGRLWELWYTSVPEPDEVERYLAAALEGQAAGHMLPWVVRDLATNTIVGTHVNPAADVKRNLGARLERRRRHLRTDE